jgi:hypothetical protein
MHELNLHTHNAMFRNLFKMQGMSEGQRLQLPYSEPAERQPAHAVASLPPLQ